jgi:hypothetical protein
VTTYLRELHVGPLVSDPERFDRLFSAFTRSAYRLEVRRAYGVTDEDLPFQQYLAGEDPGIDWLQPWLDLMSAQTRSGKSVQRVRVVDDPPSDYLRWEIANTPHNLDAGEDIRYLSRDRARALRLPDYDYWMFDDRLLVVLEFDDLDRFLGYRSTGNWIVIDEHRLLREKAWRNALTYEQYMAGAPC